MRSKKPSCLKGYERMRVIFQTPPMPAQRKDPKTGQVTEGTSYFTATLYEPGEPYPTGPTGQPDAQMMSYWRSQVRQGQPIQIGNLASLYVGLPAVAIPAAVTDPLPDDARLQLAWHWTQRGAA
jgi:hypothetical protein